MNYKDIIRMARERRLIEEDHDCIEGVPLAKLPEFINLIAATDHASMMQLFTDPENQPTQYGTVTVEYMQREIAAEREACARVCEEIRGVKLQGYEFAAAIRARGQA